MKDGLKRGRFWRKAMHVVGREGMGKGKIMRQLSLYHLSLSNCGCGLRLTHINQINLVLFRFGLCHFLCLPFLSHFHYYSSSTSFESYTQRARGGQTRILTLVSGPSHSSSFSSSLFGFPSSGFAFLFSLAQPAASFRCPILDLFESIAEGHQPNSGFLFVNKMKMKLGCKKWKSIAPRLKGKSPSPSFCLFSKTKSVNYGPGKTPVYLNVYDLTPMNGYVYWAGLGIFHSGVEVHGVEYAFGAHDYPTSGVFEVEPRQCPGFKFRRSILIGTTCLDPHEVREFMEQRSSSYYGDTYHLIVKNCNHFCRDVCHQLTGKSIPKWVNRLAKIGSVCNCILPESLRISAVRHDPAYPPYETEKTKLRNAFSCLSSISSRQKQLSSTSLFLQSPLKGWELKKSSSEPSCLKG